MAFKRGAAQRWARVQAAVPRDGEQKSPLVNDDDQDRGGASVVSARQRERLVGLDTRKRERRRSECARDERARLDVLRLDQYRSAPRIVPRIIGSGAGLVGSHQRRAFANKRKRGGYPIEKRPTRRREKRVLLLEKRLGRVARMGALGLRCGRVPHAPALSLLRSISNSRP